MVNEVKITQRTDGSKQTVVLVDAKRKGVVVGKEEDVAKARLLAKR